jgi:hypothetical protein
MSAHTTGPWVFKSEGITDYVEGADGLAVAYVQESDPHSDVPDEFVFGPISEANARLIAAAPELLAFAKLFLEDYQSEEGMNSMKRYAKAAYEAIAKAEGKA